MNPNKKIVKQYLKEVADNLSCESATKAFVINELKQSITSFTEEKAKITINDLCEEFGSPKEFAIQLSDREDFLELSKRAKKKALLWRCLGIVSIILAIVVIIFVCIVIDNLAGDVTVTYKNV